MKVSFGHPLASVALPGRFARWSAIVILGAFALSMTGCATRTPRDYSAYRAANPKTIVVLPPVNESPDVKATASMLAHVTYPLAEGGYYVIPVGLMAETFKANGLSNAADAHQAPLGKLKEIFGADAALYIRITQYGSTYRVVTSSVDVTADAKLVDLSTGTLLWEGSARASSSENQNSGGGGLAAILVTAVIQQITNSLTDASHQVAGVATNRLLTPGVPNGLLYGPRNAMHDKVKP